LEKSITHCKTRLPYCGQDMGISFLKAASQIHPMQATRPQGFDHWLGEGSDGGLNHEDFYLGLSVA
jgi:hypothetical protein